MRVAILLFASLIISPAQARWATKDSANYKVISTRRTIKVRKDASATIISEREIEILKDQGRTDSGLTRMPYDATTSQFKVLEAYTLNGSTKIPVPEKDIESKPLASSGPGFDLINQVTIAFPDVQVGSKLYYKTEEVQSRAPIPNLFYIHWALYGERIESFRVRIDSELPLYVQKLDPENSLDIRNEGNSVEISLKGEYLKWIVDEPGSMVDPRSLFWFSVSTMKDWSEFPKTTLDAYEKDLKTPLPKKFVTILDQARKQKTDFDQINAVTSRIADAVRYVGDWRALEGIFHPRSLELIAQTGFGDCKDFSVSTASILRHLGFEANVATVARGKNWIQSPLANVALDINHAIVYARKDGKEFWIDPTNLTSFAQGTYPDIANRTALVFYADHVEVKQTPKLNAEKSTIRIRKKMKLVEKTKVEAQGTIEFIGGAALRWTGFELGASKENRDYQMIDWIAPVDNLSKWKFDDLDLRSRIVRDLKTNFSYTEVVHPIATTAGQGHMIPRTGLANLFRFRLQDRVSDIIMEDPLILEMETQLSGRRVRFNHPVRCKGNSKWADYSREFVHSGGSVVMKDRLVLKSPTFPVSELKTPEFADFQSKFLDCMLEAVLVFR